MHFIDGLRRIQMDVADTDIFRKASIAYLKRIDDKLAELIILIQGTPTEVVISREDFERAEKEFGTTD